MSLWPTIWSRGLLRLGGQWRFSSGPPLSGSVSPCAPAVVISPVPECLIDIDILSSWQNPHTCSVTCGVRDVGIGKAKWRLLELPLPRKIINQ